MIKPIEKLTPQKLTIYLLYVAVSTLATVIGVLWFKLGSAQDRSNQRDDVTVIDCKAQLKVQDSLHRVEKREWSAELRVYKARGDSVTKEWNEFLKDRLANQEKVIKRAESADRKVDAISKQVTNLSSITNDMKLNN
jgi:hypothetical protein